MNPPNLIQIAAILLALALNLPLTEVLAQGNLTPPGPPGPTMLTLSQIEPRMPISSIPYTITQPGSYYLTGNLFVSTGTNGITVESPNVVIDLRGFGLYGEGVGNYGVYVPNAEQNVVVRNGILENWVTGVQSTNAINSTLENLQCWEVTQNGLCVGVNGLVRDCTILNTALGGGGNGIQAGDGSTVIHCVAGNASNHFSYGIVLGRGCVMESSTITSNFIGAATSDGTTVRGCSFLGNVAYGLQTGSGCTISGCTAFGNGPGVVSSGITTGPGCTIIGCTALENYEGISTGTGSTIKECTVVSNATTGVSAGAGCTIADCTANENSGSGIIAASECTVSGCTASANNQDGIQATFSCLIKGNTCSSNSRYVVTGGSGIHVLDSGTRIEDNVLNSDQYGIKVDGTDNFIVRNTVRSSGTDNYDIASGNMVDTIISAVSSGSILGSTGGTSFGTTDPWANFSF